MPKTLKIVFIAAIFFISALGSVAWADEWTLTVKKTDTGGNVVIVNAKIDAKIREYDHIAIYVELKHGCDNLGEFCPGLPVPDTWIDKDTRSWREVTEQTEFSAFASGSSLWVELIILNPESWVYIDVSVVGVPIIPGPNFEAGQEWFFVVD